MILRLRKRHRSMWLIIGILLPVLYVLALMARPDVPVIEGAPISQPTTMVLKELANQPALQAWLTKDEQDHHYIEIELKKPTQHPLATFYIGQTETAQLETYRLLGAVAAQGRQRFMVDSLLISQPKQFLLQYDPVRKEKISTVTLVMQ